MDPNNLNFSLNSQDPNSSQYYSNPQHEKSEFFMYNNQVSIPENTQTPQKSSKAAKRETREDIVLMSGWIYVSVEPIQGKNQKIQTFWSRVKNYYDETRAENPEGLGIRNENQMKSRHARLNEAANKLVAEYREAYRQKRSGMSTKDAEKEAYAIFLEHNTTRSRPEYEVDDEESGGSTKRSRTSEGDYSVETNKEIPNSGVSKVQRPMGRDAAKKKGKGKASQSFVVPDYYAEFHSLNITKKIEVEMMSKKMEFENDKAQHKTLHILLANENLSPGEEAVEQRLLKFYG
ncbi:hypothetical protein OSB04_019347 [Centaurea solstitialis]|uniref:Uncharacterized protein n=1 Tax=Centaurea solstitialis TaxID=347529 RepID=A0AA38SRT6_9ASTR|nr:hypothetical protein OSB04_019347 [Centaurea solstitialis]